MTERGEHSPWDRLDEPWRALPEPVQQALDLLASCEDEDGSRHAYNVFLFAVGNNHAGTYFPVVVHTIPFLAALLDSGGAHPRAATLDALIDLLGSFEPDVLSTDARELEGLQTELRQQAWKLEARIRVLAGLGAGQPDKVASLARELLDVLAWTRRDRPETTTHDSTPRS